MANSTRIIYNADSIGGVLVRNAMVNLANAVNLTNQALQLANSVCGDTGVTTANLEGSTEFGVGAGQGSSFYTTLNGLAGRVNAAAQQLAIANLYKA